MVINLIGDTDKRPVLYTIMKVCQMLGDVLLVTNSSRLIRLSDTHESMGHCQNVMIAVTQEGIDDFWSSFPYEVSDFEYVIVDNIIIADADVTIHVQGMASSDYEQDALAYLENYEIISMYPKHLVDLQAIYACEEFEAYHDFCPISQKLAVEVCAVMAKYSKIPEKDLVAMAMKPTSTHPKVAPNLTVKTNASKTKGVISWLTKS